jgi:vanillate/3-O-methylgallate O-demethylase
VRSDGETGVTRPEKGEVMTTVTTDSLEDKLQRLGNPAEWLRNVPLGPYAYPMKSEFTNWRDEQRAWRTTAVLFDQSFHMTDVYFKGPDVVPLLSELGVNTFSNFARGKAKQFVACNYDGYVIGDAILFILEDDEVSLVGRPIVPDWVAFHAVTGGYDVTVTRDERSVDNDARRMTFRYQIQGPHALHIVEAAHGGPIERIKFFNIGEFEIAGAPIRALNHTMAGVPGLEMTGLELMGPSEYGESVMASLLEAGKEFGLREGGSRAYPTTAVESGWIPSPLPAIYTGEAMRPFRQWLSARSWEANASIGGSFYSDRIDDYYATPWDLGYGHIIKFDHEFIGREALEEMADQPHRRKVWLRWNDEDVEGVIASSLFGAEPERGKYLELPSSNYSTGPYDKLLIGDRVVGVSANSGYTVNVGGWSSLAMVDEAVALDGTEVTLVWGEENGGSAKPSVERHVQKRIRATISTHSLVEWVES